MSLWKVGGNGAQLQLRHFRRYSKKRRPSDVTTRKDESQSWLNAGSHNIVTTDNLYIIYMMMIDVLCHGSFVARTIPEWNRLPAAAADAVYPTSFHSRLNALPVNFWPCGL